MTRSRWAGVAVVDRPAGSGRARRALVVTGLAVAAGGQLTNPSDERHDQDECAESLRGEVRPADGRDAHRRRQCHRAADDDRGGHHLHDHGQSHAPTDPSQTVVQGTDDGERDGQRGQLHDDGALIAITLADQAESERCNERQEDRPAHRNDADQGHEPLRQAVELFGVGSDLGDVRPDQHADQNVQSTDDRPGEREVGVLLGTEGGDDDHRHEQRSERAERGDAVCRTEVRPHLTPGRQIRLAGVPLFGADVLQDRAQDEDRRHDRGDGPGGDDRGTALGREERQQQHELEDGVKDVLGGRPSGDAQAGGGLILQREHREHCDEERKRNDFSGVGEHLVHRRNQQEAAAEHERERGDGEVAAHDERLGQPARDRKESLVHRTEAQIGQRREHHRGGDDRRRAAHLGDGVEPTGRSPEQQAECTGDGRREHQGHRVEREVAIGGLRTRSRLGCRMLDGVGDRRHSDRLHGVVPRHGLHRHRRAVHQTQVEPSRFDRIPPKLFELFVLGRQDPGSAVLHNRTRPTATGGDGAVISRSNAAAVAARSSARTFSRRSRP